MKSKHYKNTDHVLFCIYVIVNARIFIIVIILDYYFMSYYMMLTEVNGVICSGTMGEIASCETCSECNSSHQALCSEDVSFMQLWIEVAAGITCVLSIVGSVGTAASYLALKEM